MAVADPGARHPATRLGCLDLRVVNVNCLARTPGPLMRTTMTLFTGSLRFLKRLPNALDAVAFGNDFFFVLNAHPLFLPFGPAQVIVTLAPAGSFFAVSVVTVVAEPRTPNAAVSVAPMARSEDPPGRRPWSRHR